MRSYLPQILVAACWATDIVASSAGNHNPDLKAAETHAFALFNSIHSAMRQWGSSVHHNGMSFFLAQAPEGSVFYHGSASPETPWSFEWLAFEFEHAGVFAESWEPQNHTSLTLDFEPPSVEPLDDVLLWHRTSRLLSPPTPEHVQFFDRPSAQQLLSGVAQDKDEDRIPGPQWPDLNKTFRGYFHMYRANRPLNLLYMDGEAAAKCTLGPMDSQDLILLDREHQVNSTKGLMGHEMQRAKDMCTLAKEWSFAAGGKIDGFIRMEAGFEIIYCDWTPKGGLDLLSVQGSPLRNETGIDDSPDKVTLVGSALTVAFEWLRASSQRFHGHPAGRLDVDWSSMVSAFGYPVNLTNADRERQDLPRLTNTTKEERRNIRARLREVVIERGGRSTAEKGVVSWQGVVDNIVTRFSKRLWSLANAGLKRNDLIATIGSLIDPFTDYLDHSPMAEQLAIDRCAQHYVDPQLLRPETWTPEDHAIAAAIGVVSSTICTSLFTARNILRFNSTESKPSAEEAQEIFQKLIDDLRWSTWKDCEGCAWNEICSIPMFPMGSKEDYYHPSCKNITGMLNSRGYWGF